MAFGDSNSLGFRNDQGNLIDPFGNPQFGGTNNAGQAAAGNPIPSTAPVDPVTPPPVFGQAPGGNAAAVAAGQPIPSYVNPMANTGNPNNWNPADPGNSNYINPYIRNAPDGWSGGNRTVGMQFGPGDIGFGTYGPSATTTPATPASPTTPAYPGQGNWHNDAGQQVNPWDGSQYKDTGTPYSSGVDITDPNQAWQKFQFQNPTEDWQKNFNSIADPVTRMRYAYQNGASGNGEYLNSYLSQAGIDPWTINTMRSVFGAPAGYNTREQFNGLGLNTDQMMNGINGSFQQIGNQLWNIRTDGTKQLIKDFGNSGNMGDSTVQNSASTAAMYNPTNFVNNPWLMGHSANYGFNAPQAFGNAWNYGPSMAADSAKG